MFTWRCNLANREIVVRFSGNNKCCLFQCWSPASWRLALRSQSASGSLTFRINPRMLLAMRAVYVNSVLVLIQFWDNRGLHCPGLQAASPGPGVECQRPSPSTRTLRVQYCTFSSAFRWLWDRINFEAVYIPQASLIRENLGQPRLSCLYAGVVRVRGLDFHCKAASKSKSQLESQIRVLLKLSWGQSCHTYDRESWDYIDIALVSSRWHQVCM